MKIGIIGGGNMATSLLGGLIAKQFDPKTLWISDPNQSKLDTLKEKFSVNTTLDNEALCSEVDVIVFAVKPQVLRKVIQGVKTIVRNKMPLVISIAAGICEVDLQRWFGGDAQISIVRCMPNTPALIGCGMTAMVENAFVSQEQKQRAQTILQAVGSTLWLDNEKALNAATALSGAGPAYFFLVIEALEHAGEVIGLTKEEAKILTLQTALGASRMALESEESLAVLRERVTSPGGVTERALRALESGGLRQLFTHALQEAKLRGEEIAHMLGQQD